MKYHINRKLTRIFSILSVLGAGFAVTFSAAPAAHAQGAQTDVSATARNATYADLATLSDQSELVIRAQIRRQTALKSDRAPGLAAGFARLYMEARTITLISGRSAVGQNLAYLVDVPLDARGRAPRFKGREVVLFANRVPGRAGELQLVSEAGQLDYSPALEERLRPILTELLAPKAPPRITGISDALAVPGTLVGESETQIFLATTNRAPASITILRRPGQRPEWGVSWGEIIDSAARPPERETLGWFRLACSLPPQLPSNANLARDANARRLAMADYAMVLEQLGPCEKHITRAS